MGDQDNIIIFVAKINFWLHGMCDKFNFNKITIITKCSKVEIIHIPSRGQIYTNLDCTSKEMTNYEIKQLTCQ